MDQNQRTPQIFVLTVMLLTLAHGAGCDMNKYGKQNLFAV
jgi:hypothetical protein